MKKASVAGVQKGCREPFFLDAAKMNAYFHRMGTSLRARLGGYQLPDYCLLILLFGLLLELGCDRMRKAESTTLVIPKDDNDPILKHNIMKVRSGDITLATWTDGKLFDHF